MYDVVVVGGGVIGLSIARELRASSSVLIIERDLTGQGTSWAAAGMLSPQSEADADDPFFQLCMRSLGMFSAWADEIRASSQVDPECDKTGLLVLASSEADVAILRARYDWQHAAGFPVQMLEPWEVRQREPLITVDVHGALFLPSDYQVAPRPLVEALRVDCLDQNVEVRTHTIVEAVVSENGRATGVRIGDETIEARSIVIAGGVWSASIHGLSPRIPLSPRKGQILSLTAPSGAFSHMIRWSHSYFVPRRDGELIVGATNENAGFDRTLTPAGVGRLLTEAQQISSHVGSYPIRETWTGLRPATPDGWPVIGPSDIEGLFYATGHYRNGILLAPITAAIVASLIRGEPSPVPIAAFAPGRFNV